ncbi:exo-alpha-sialidase [bacterium]|nr:exo-alpha-sialidase [bacterium]
MKVCWGIFLFASVLLHFFPMAMGQNGFHPSSEEKQREGAKMPSSAEMRIEKCEKVIAVKGGGYFPVLIKLKNGELCAVVRGGAPHIGEGGRLDLIKSSDGGRTWSEPRTIANIPPDSRNPAFGQSKKGTLILAFAVTGPYENGQFTLKSQEYTVWITRSFDNGETWEKPYRIELSPLQYASPYGKIVQLEDGTLLMNIYAWFIAEPGESLPPERQGVFSYVLRSRDDGKTWGEPTLIARHFDETTLLPLGKNRVLAIMRGEKSDGLWQSISQDGGLNWSEPRRITEGPRLPADAILLKSGAILLTYGRRLPPYGVEGMLSYDGGMSWDSDNRFLLEWEAKNPDCGYPSSVQLDDGTIITIYYGVGHLKYTDLNEYAICAIYREDSLKPAK